MTNLDAGQCPADGHGVTVLHGGLSSHDSPRRHSGSAGGNDSKDRAAVPAGSQGSIASQDSEQPSWRPGTATDPWPAWAQPQLHRAVSIAQGVANSGRGSALAGELYRRWFNPITAPPLELGRPLLPLAGLYRSAHAGSASRIVIDGMSVVDRHDVVGRDGWWRTWGDAWMPTRSRANAVRILLSPRPDALTSLIATVTAALLDDPAPWLLACPTDPQRLRRPASSVLYLPDVDALPDGLLDALQPILRTEIPPLCLPLVPGAALAEYPDNGMSFGEHRCHLLALALRTPLARKAPLHAIADVFTSHGIDPAQPHRS
jgi:hypothetical protein